MVILDALHRKFLGINRKETPLYKGPRSQILMTPDVDVALPDSVLAQRRREEREKLRKKYSTPRRAEVNRLYGEAVHKLWRIDESIHGDEKSTFMEQEVALERFRDFLRKLK